MYPAKFIHENRGEYSVLFPDLKGCCTCGDNWEHALLMAKEALGLYLVALEEHGHVAPAATCIKTINIEQNENVVPIMVDISDFRRDKTEVLLLNETGS